MKSLIKFFKVTSEGTLRSRILQHAINKAYANYYEHDISKPLAKDKIPFREISSGIPYSHINKDILTEELKAFFDFYKFSYPNHKYFAIQFKITLDNGGSKTISHIQISKLEDFEILLEVFYQLFSKACEGIEISEDIHKAEISGMDDDDEDDDSFHNTLPAGIIILGFMPLTNVKTTKYTT